MCSLLTGKLHTFYVPQLANGHRLVAEASLMSFIPASQVLFGTDSPFVPTEVTARGAPRSSLRVRVLSFFGGAPRACSFQRSNVVLRTRHPAEKRFNRQQRCLMVASRQNIPERLSATICQQNW